MNIKVEIPLIELIYDMEDRDGERIFIVDEETTERVVKQIEDNQQGVFTAHYSVCNYSAGRPAKVFGPVEKCHPAEPAEFELYPGHASQSHMAVASILRVCPINAVVHNRWVSHLAESIEKWLEQWEQDHAPHIVSEAIYDEGISASEAKADALREEQMLEGF